MRRFLMTTDAEALASSWQRTMTRDKLSECPGLFVQKLKSRVRKPERRWTSVNRRFVRLGRRKIRQFPRIEWVDHRVQEPELDQVQGQMKRTQMIVGRNVSNSQGEDVEELAARAEEQHLDAGVEVPAHKTWRVEDVVGDAADAAPEQMNSLVQSKTEVFEKIEESLRPPGMVEDLDDDEIVELCTHSNELNACETTAILNPSKFASCAMRLGLREGFAVDLTIARANGTMWDLSLEDDKAELRRVQNREEPELLAGSPPSDDFNSLLNTRVESQEISKLKTERIEPQIRTCVQAYKLLMAMQKHFVHEHS